MQLSPQQTAILEAFHRTTRNLCVSAAAGSGKTTTLRLLAESVTAFPGFRGIYVCFNRSIKEEAAEKLKHLQWLKVSTSHAVAMASAYKVHGNTLQVETGKLDAVVEAVASARLKKDDLPFYDDILDDLTAIIPLVMATMTDASQVGRLHQLADEQGLVLACAEKSMPLVADCLQVSRAEQEKITYDDMLDHCLHYSYPVNRYHLVLVDEAQDLTAQQIELCRRIMMPGEGRIVAVGDRSQAIYGWRGASFAAMDDMVRIFSMDELPLSVSYRCPRAVVALARTTGATIDPADDAPQGEVLHFSPETRGDLLKQLCPGDMVLCRINAPLIGAALSLARLGIRACVRGRDLAGSMRSWTRKWSREARTYGGMIAYGQQTVAEQLDQLKREKKDPQVDALTDRWGVLYTLATACTTIKELYTLIEKTFSDDATNAVLLSTVHRAKGLEAPRVIILGPEMMPWVPGISRSSRPADVMRQEKNLQYVAWTRAQKTLVFQPIADAPPWKRRAEHPEE